MTTLVKIKIKFVIMKAYIKRQNLGKLTLNYFYSLLKNSKKARLSFLKKFLTRNKIVYETGSWESIDYN